jgi:hypothetical protein
MGEFKPMVKMETTEPTVELKLKKGGKVEKKMQMGGSPAVAPGRVGTSPATPASDMARGGGGLPGAAPMAPALAARRRAMRQMGTGPAAPVGRAADMTGAMMKKGGKAEGGDMAQDKAMIKKAIKQHDMQEHKGGKGTKLKLKGGGMSCATGGGVKMGQGGYKEGGIISFRPETTTKVVTAKENAPSGSTTGVKNGNGGGYKKGGSVPGGGVTGNVDTTPAGVTNTETGSVKKGNGGGYRKGGAAKKFAEGGRVQNDGGPEQMPQGKKKPMGPVYITELAGTY